MIHVIRALSLAFCFLMIHNSLLCVSPHESIVRQYLHQLDSMVAAGEAESAVNDLYRAEEKIAAGFSMSGGNWNYDAWVRPFYDAAIGWLTDLYISRPNHDYAQIIFRFMERNKILADIDRSLRVPIQYSRFITPGEHQQLADVQRKYNSIADTLRLADIFSHGDLYADLEIPVAEKLLRLKLENPEYYQHALNTQVPTIAEVQHNLLAGEKAYLKIHELSKRYVFCIITSDHLFILSVALSPAITEALAVLQRRMSVKPESNKPDRELIEASHLLFNTFFTALFDINPRLTDLVIVPDKQTSSVAFEALVSDIFTRNNDVEGVRWLIQRLRINYTHFVRHDLTMSRRDSYVRGRKSILGIFPESAGQPDHENLMQTGLKRLNQELGFSGDILSGRRAGRRSFTERYNQYKIIHYGKPCERIGTRGPVCFSFNPQRDENRLLCTDEWYSMSFNADLMVMSDCHLRTGNELNYEQYNRLNHAIRHQKGPVFLVSIWPVEEQYQWRIFDYFYRGLIDGHNIHQAWHLARIKWINQFDINDWSGLHPYYWAGYINTGFDNSIDLQKSRKYPLWVMIYLISIFFVFIMYRVFKYRQGVYVPDNQFHLQTDIPGDGDQQISNRTTSHTS